MKQTILVTGSTSGFGRLMVETLARQGYQVFAGMRAVVGKNAPAAEALSTFSQREQLALHPIEIDVTDDASVERAIAAIVGQAGRLDVVVNNAGVSYSGPLEAFTPEQVSQQFETNVFSVLRVGSGSLEQDGPLSLVTMEKEEQTGLVHQHRPGKRERHADKTGQALAQGVIPALHMSGFSRLFSHRAVLLLRNHRSVCRPEVGEARPLTRE